MTPNSSPAATNTSAAAGLEHLIGFFRWDRAFRVWERDRDRLALARFILVKSITHEIDWFLDMNGYYDFGNLFQAFTYLNVNFDPAIRLEGQGQNLG